jgi:hypothetical protein
MPAAEALTAFAMLLLLLKTPALASTHPEVARELSKVFM